MEHQEDASDGKDKKEKAGNPSKTEGIGESEAVPFYLCRENMEKEVVIDHHGPFQIGIRYSGSENRTPHCRI
jgi:hypothetical protein